ncbi:MAG TPA: glycolate oxidase subunit GlcF [Rhodospirillales bacterium]|jgi:glycolate oxidase iron-sulfur subunit|nr:glycolate oxidase subunit GlcF [Rhodospirillales bacterium]
MRTHFSTAQLADPRLREANDIFRKCVHCGFCAATCPTHVLLGDELDSPRGRIYLIKDMLEQGKPAAAAVAKHLDRCLSCLSCMTACPSEVDYMHLIDGARAHVEKTLARPLAERILRSFLALILPNQAIFRLALIGARAAQPLAGLFPGRLKSIIAILPASASGPAGAGRPQVFPARTIRRKRVALLTGCAQQVLRPAINEATVRLLTRHGCEVVVAKGAGCCGAIVHHLGKEKAALAAARANIAAWERAAGAGGLDAVAVNASGCGTMVKDYGHMLAGDRDWGKRAARISSLAKDVSEVMASLGLDSVTGEARAAVTYQSPCSLQHGQQVFDEPKRLLADAGFHVLDAPEEHLCCGSAGTYSLMQPNLASRLGDRKTVNLESTGAQVIATGNIGCLMQIAGIAKIPVVHTVELLDWATGGPAPEELT